MSILGRPPPWGQATHKESRSCHSHTGPSRGHLFLSAAAHAPGTCHRAPSVVCFVPMPTDAATGAGCCRDAPLNPSVTSVELFDCEQTTHRRESGGGTWTCQGVIGRTQRRQDAGQGLGTSSPLAAQRTHGAFAKGLYGRVTGRPNMGEAIPFPYHNPKCQEPEAGKDGAEAGDWVGTGLRGVRLNHTSVRQGASQPEAPLSPTPAGRWHHH